MFKTVPESHLDHSISKEQLDFLLSIFADRKAFFIETVELPRHLGTVPCMLYGPKMGDDPIIDGKPLQVPYAQVPVTVLYLQRGERKYASRILHGFRSRPTARVTVIGGPHGDEPCVLYTAFGGPLAPKEPGELAFAIADFVAEHVDGLDGKLADDKREQLVKLKRDYVVSRDFWAEHALTIS